MTFSTILSQSTHLILDGATGTELNRRGVDTGLPLWSANALMNERDAGVLQNVHEDYLRAGADIISTNTFRTHRRALAHSGNADREFELTRRAVEIARVAIANVPADKSRFVAGSISTLEDCYRPDLVNVRRRKWIPCWHRFLVNILSHSGLPKDDQRCEQQRGKSFSKVIHGIGSYC